VTIVRPLCARPALPQKPVFYGSPANRFAAQSDHSMVSRQQRLGAHAILVLHNATYRPNPNPRAGGPSHGHLRGMALAQHNVDYRTSLRSAFRVRFQKVFLGGSQKPGSHRASCTHKAHVKAKPRCTLWMRFGVARLHRACPHFVAPRRGRFQICVWHGGPCPAVRPGAPGHGRARPAVPHVVLREALTLCHEMRPHPTRGSEEKTLANGGRFGYYARVNLDTRGEEV
jgi:hypothetical protein